jgi:hypothetical protein
MRSYVMCGRFVYVICYEAGVQVASGPDDDEISAVRIRKIIWDDRTRARFARAHDDYVARSQSRFRKFLMKVVGYVLNICQIKA